MYVYTSIYVYPQRRFARIELYLLIVYKLEMNATYLIISL